MGRVWILIAVVGASGCVRAYDRPPATHEGGPGAETGPAPDGPALDLTAGEGRDRGLVPLDSRPGDGGPGPWISINAATATPFLMGAPAGEPCLEPDETPHQVTLTRSFRIATNEVTQAELLAALGYNPSANKSCPTCPAENVSWSEAAAYCNTLSALVGVTPCYTCTGSGASVSCTEAGSFAGVKIYDCPGYRLPTEAEWELSARGGTTTSFYGGDVTKCLAADPLVAPYAWYKSNAQDATHPVGTKLPGPLGLHDTAGNVYEWTHDFYANYPSSAAANPVGPASASHRVIRGGAYWDDPTYLRLGSRGVVPEDSRKPWIGLRWVRSASP